MPTVCPCPACSDLRGDLSLPDDHVCFPTLPGHGQCVDPHQVGCTCAGTAADGECEGCWLWLK